MTNQDHLRQLEEKYEAERLYNNVFLTCHCGEVVEANQTDMEWLICPACNRVGCWNVEENNA